MLTHTAHANTTNLPHTHTLAANGPGAPGEIAVAGVCGGVSVWRCVGGWFTLRAFPAISPHLCRFRHDAAAA